MFEVVRWLTVCLIISMIMKPLFPFGALKPADGGFCVSLGLGTGIMFTAVWFVCAVIRISFGSVSCVVCVVLFVLFVLLKSKAVSAGKEICDDNIAGERRRFLLGFAAFALLFIIAFWVKGYKPFIDHQTEQYMDYGFMNAMYRQRRVPFEDMWFAGKRVNYYYLGQAAAVFLCRLAFVTPEYGYNLMLCTLFASFGISVFVLVDSFLFLIKGMKRRYSVTGGIMASLMCTCGGNGHWIIYGIIKQIENKIRGVVPDKRYWFPTSTLFIGYDPDTLDKAKHEFPSYTLVLGDLHAHVCNMLFTIPFLILLIDYALTPKEHKKRSQLLIMGLILGLFKGVNYWDFPIYFVVAGAVILFCDVREAGMNVPTVMSVLLKGLFIYITGTLVMLPFSLNYSIPTGGIHLCDRHSPIDKFIIIWFVHLIMVLSLLMYIFLRMHSVRRTGDKPRFTVHELIITAITLCGLGLLMLPELVYVKDIYGDKFQRYNTMFKLTFQGFILLSISAGICIGVFLNGGSSKKRVRVILKSAGCIYSAAALALAAYMGWSVRAWFGNVFDVSSRKGISASDFISEDPSYDNVREAIDILNKDRNTRLRIIEEAGNSYRDENRLSVFTGASTVEGWYVHEWVWHGDGDEVKARRGEVNYFYTGGDEEYCRELIGKYNLDYIYVGPSAVKRYDINYEGFRDLGEHVWDSKDGRYMLIRVDKTKI